MPLQFTPAQRLFIYSAKDRGTSYPIYANQFSLKFGTPAPTRKNCYLIHRRIAREHTAHNLNRRRSGPRFTERTDENVLRVVGDVLEYPRLGTHRRAASLDLSRSTLRRLLKDANMYPYRMQRHHELQLPDLPKRVTFGNWFEQKCIADLNYDDTILYTDECHVDISGYVNSQNAVHWGTSRPTEVISRPLHPIRVTIWIAISSAGLIGPYFVEENGRTVTVNGQRYLDILENHFYPDLSDFTISNPQLDPNWSFMQDGARPHIYNPARDFLNQKFSNRTIGDRMTEHWPARSPDLTPCDFFLFGWLKDKIYEEGRLTNRQHLKDTIRNTFASLDNSYCANACRAVRKRCQKMVSVGGGLFEHLL